MITKDTYHKVKEQYKNETLFARDQKEHPEKFDEIANEVWYAGAALVNEDGEVEKILRSLMQVRVKDEIGNLTKTEIPFMKLKVQEI